MSVELGAAIAVVGCLVGVAGWLYNREKKINEDAQWRGGVDAKLDVIVGITNDVSRLESAISNQATWMGKLEASVASAHKRIDEHVREGRG
ncbi:MAG: hypothetical protein LIO58_05160 [Oscillospiraceae bacterium]|nr:hypothetical protein [Oscillospiraceae bacterium]